MQTSTLITILVMAVITYLTRIGGYLFLRNRVLSPRMKVVLDAAPGCVLISVIAPKFASSHPADFLALILTVIAASRLPLLPTVVIAVSSSGLLRHLFL
jgi:uncharacterized membrane protein